jgi:hypothetical protein
MQRFFHERGFRRTASPLVSCTVGSSSALGDVRAHAHCLAEALVVRISMACSGSLNR